MSETNSTEEISKLDWSTLTEWGRQWVAEYLREMDAASRDYLQSGGEFNETVLSMELHSFFRTDKVLPSKWEPFVGGQSMLELCKRLDLDEFEGFCLSMVLLSELEYNFEKLFVYLNNDWNQRLLSIEWAIRLYTCQMKTDASYLRYFLPEGKLVRYLFDIRSEHHISGLRKGLKLKSPIFEWLINSGRFQDKSYLKWNPKEREELQLRIEDSVCRRLSAAILQGKKDKVSTILSLQGGVEEGLLYGNWYGKQEQQPVALLDFQIMQEILDEEQYETLFEEVFLQNGVLCVKNMENFLKEEKTKQKWLAWVQKAVNWIPVLFLLGTSEKQMGLQKGNNNVLLKLQFLKGEARLQLWQQLGQCYGLEKESVEQAAERYHFWVEEIEESLRRAVQLACEREETEVLSERLIEACQRQLQHNLSAWAQPIKIKFGWEDLILPEDQKEILLEAVNHIKYQKQVHEDWGFGQKLPYGAGLSILFTGPPGTGKTMAAQVLAGALGMELYKIQLPAVVSKYIGETEKNLKQIFQEGEKSQAVLFFDEADVLFSKRTEVKDSHDKYSNMEAAFMLQKMEDYEGVVILATNFPQNIDEAFKRRIKFVLEFFLPDQQYRYLLWQKSIPGELPLDFDVDFEFLAERFELSGSNIKNVMVNAAFLAASQEKCVGMAHILKALENEYKKSGKYFSEEEKGEYANRMDSC